MVELGVVRVAPGHVREAARLVLDVGGVGAAEAVARVRLGKSRNGETFFHHE